MTALWIEYLLSAYPPLKERRAGTIVVLERQFADTDERVMERVAEAAVQAHKFFPSVAELRQVRAALLAKSQQAADHDEANVWGKVTRLEKLRREIDTWRDCPGDCGERVPPGVALCPFCADLANMIAMAEPAAAEVSW